MVNESHLDIENKFYLFKKKIIVNVRWVENFPLKLRKCTYISILLINMSKHIKYLCLIFENNDCDNTNTPCLHVCLSYNA